MMHISRKNSNAIFDLASQLDIANRLGYKGFHAKWGKPIQKICSSFYYRLMAK
jgi:hypothetical protein